MTSTTVPTNRRQFRTNATAFSPTTGTAGLAKTIARQSPLNARTVRAMIESLTVTGVTDFPCTTGGRLFVERVA